MAIPIYDRENPPPPVPHPDHDVECCGLLLPVQRGDLADFVCNECGAILCAVPLDEAEAILPRMAIKTGICSETCPNCGELNVFPGFTSMDMFSCWRCGVGVKVDRKIIH